MSMYQVVQILKSNCETIKTVHLAYNEKDPLMSDYMIKLVNDGIILCFDSKNQRLKLIEISDLRKLKLRYCGNYFNNLPAVQPTNEQINDTFGITSPGGTPKITHGIQSLHYPAGQPPLVSKISIYNGSSPSTSLAPDIPTACLNKDIFLNKLSVIRDADRTTKGIQLNIFMQGTEKTYHQVENKDNLEVEIFFDDTCQDVLSLIGSPTSVYYKSEELSKLNHNESLLANALTQANNQFDYFYNYVTLGLDILFSADTHRVTKFVLHSNYPCHYNFNSYFMCNFELLLNLKGSNGHINVTPLTKWDKIQEHLNVKTPPAILHRSSTTNSVNPFGPTFCYLFEDIIFEVMANGHLASVTLLNNKQN